MTEFEGKDLRHPAAANKPETPLATTTKSREGQLAEVTHTFYGLSALDTLNPKVACEQNEVLNKRSKAFYAELRELVPDSLDNPTKVERLKEYIGLNHADNSRLDYFISSELMTVFNLFRKTKAFDAMFEMSQRSGNTLFSNSEIVRELAAVACNKKEQPDPERTLEIAGGLLEEGLENGEVFGAIGKAFLLKHEAAKEVVALSKEKLQKPDDVTMQERLEAAEAKFKRYFPDDSLQDAEMLAQRSLEQSLDGYEKGFTVAYEFYPGINVAYRQLALGRLEDVAPTCEMVFNSCLRDGGIESKDYWCVTSMLEASCLSNKPLEEIQPILEKVLELAWQSWMVDTTTYTLSNARNQFQQTREKLAEEIRVFGGDPDKRASEQPETVPADLLQKYRRMAETESKMTTVISALSERLQLTKAVEASKDEAKKQAVQELERSLAEFKKSPNLSPAQLSTMPIDDLNAALNKMLPPQLNSHLARLTEDRRSQYLHSIDESRLNEIKIQAMLDSSFSYRGLASNFIGGETISGNLRGGRGQLFDQTISRYDVRQFDEVLKASLEDITHYEVMEEEGKRALEEARALGLETLQDIKDRGLFSRVATALVRHHFKTHEIEVMQDPRHDIYDAKVAGAIEVGGATERKGTDSRTNISIALAIALGDCRHHGQAMQMLCDAWQKDQFNVNLDKQHAAIKRGDYKEYQALMEEFNELSEWELRTFDIILETQAEMEVKYKPKRDEHGQLIVDPKGGFYEMEDHTCTLWLNRKRGLLEFADTFYRNVYNLGSGTKTLAEIDLRVVEIQSWNEKKNGYDVTPVLSMVVPVDPLKWTDVATGENRSCPVRFFRTPYAGTRHVPTDETGAPRFMGNIVDESMLLAEMLTRQATESKKRFHHGLLDMPGARKVLNERGVPFPEIDAL